MHFVHWMMVAESLILAQCWSIKAKGNTGSVFKQISFCVLYTVLYACASAVQPSVLASVQNRKEIIMQLFLSQALRRWRVDCLSATQIASHRSVVTWITWLPWALTQLLSSPGWIAWPQTSSNSLPMLPVNTWSSIRRLATTFRKCQVLHGCSII